MLGTLFKTKNEFWIRDYKRGWFFAWNKRRSGFHPGVIKSVSPDGFSFQLAPGTTKAQDGSCVFKVSFVAQRKSYFLLNKSLPITEDELAEFEKGWGNQTSLSDEQIGDMSRQNNFCLGKVKVVEAQ